MFTQERALRSFGETIETLRSAGLTVIGAAAVCFINGVRTGLDTKEVEGALQEAVAARGLKTASVYRYLGLAKALATGLGEGAVKAVTEARSPGLAAEAIGRWFASEGITSLDGLGENLGTYRRTPKSAKQEAASASSSAAKPHDAAVRGESSVEVDPRVWAQQLAAELTDIELCFALADIFADRGEELEAASKKGTRRSAAHAPAAAAHQ